jgi:peptide-methionine (S)-S-oxide reductase
MKNMKTLILLLCMAGTLSSCAQSESHKVKEMDKSTNTTSDNTAAAIDTATFGEGCFWCSEAIFTQLKGVISVTSGYSGGQRENPTYEQVCSGATGHAEVIQVVYDPKQISYEDLLQAFWSSHDPTTLNRQGNDVGTQYRSVIFYHNPQQKELAEKYKEQIEKSHAYKDPIVTEIAPFTKFYKAEDYHQVYYQNHGSQPYCQFIIRPKVEKFQKQFKDKLK